MQNIIEENYNEDDDDSFEMKKEDQEKLVVTDQFRSSTQGPGEH